MLFNGQNKRFVDPRYFLREVEEQTPAPAAPAEQYKIRTKGSGSAVCRDVASKIQGAARSAIAKFAAEEKGKGSLKRLESRISDNLKIGATTLSIINIFAKAAGISAFPNNKSGYEAACKMTPDQVNKIVAAIQNNPNAVKQVAETTPTVPPEELKRRTTITNKSLNYYGMKIIVRDIDADKQDPNAEVMTLTIKTPENKTYKGSSRSLQGRFENASDDVYNQKESEAIASALFKIPLDEKERLRRMVLGAQQQPAAPAKQDAAAAAVKPEITGTIQKTTKQVPGGTETKTTSDATIRNVGEPSFNVVEASDGRKYVYAKIAGPNGEIYEGYSEFTGNIGLAREAAKARALAKMSRREPTIP